MDVTSAALINARFAIFDMQGSQIKSGITDKEGKFKSRLLPIGFYRIVVNHVGYKESNMQIQVFDDIDPLHEIFLEKM